MRNISIGQILVLILFILVPLANYVLARLQRRFDPPRAPRQPMPDMGMRRQAAPVDTPASPAPRDRTQATPPDPMLAPSPRGWSKKTLFTSRRDMRRVIVAMTILGPCRTDDPPG